MSCQLRCDPATRAVIEAALAEARQVRHDYLGTEHLLLALAMHHDSLPEPVAQLLPNDEAVRSALTSILECGGPPGPNAELLGTLGIDLDQVRASVRRTFGDHALDGLGQRRVHQPWQPWRRPHRACMSLLAGSLSVAPRVKQAFEHAWDDTVRRERETIDPATLLLGIVEVEDSLANRLLRDLGVAPEHLHHTLRQALS